MIVPTRTFHLPALPTVLVAFLLWRYIRGRIKRHVDVPSIGFSLPGLAFLSGIKAQFKYDDMVLKGYRKYPNGIFKVPWLTEWSIVVTGSLFEEVVHLPESKASFRLMLDDQLQLSALLGPEACTRNIHLSGIRQLTRRLDKVFDDIHEEIALQCKRHFTTKPKKEGKWWRKESKERIDIPEDEWMEKNAHEIFPDVVSCLNQRILVGLPQARDEKWGKDALAITADLAIRGFLLYCTPTLFRPLARRIFGLYRGPMGRCEQRLQPEIAQRLALCEEERPSDMISWLLDRSTDEKEVLAAFHMTDLAATGTTSTTLIQALFYLASYPQYIEQLRDEIVAVVGDSGWSKKSTDNLVKLDSFIRETQRIAPLSSTSINRLVVEDLTLSNGVFLPKGTIVQGVATAIHLDPNVYSDAAEFQPFRFVNENAKPEEPRKEMTTVSLDYLAFGYGRNACPGRWYAQMVIKTIIAHILMNYDFELEKKWEGKHPPDFYFQGGIIPNISAKLRFRRRKTSASY